MSFWGKLFPPSEQASPSPPATPQPVLEAANDPASHARNFYRTAVATYPLNTDEACRRHWQANILPMFDGIKSSAVQQALRDSFWSFLVDNFVYAPAEPLASVKLETGNMALPVEEAMPPYATTVNYNMADYYNYSAGKFVDAVPGQTKVLFGILTRHIPQLASFEDIRDCVYAPLYTFAENPAALVQELSSFIGGCVFPARNGFSHPLFLHSNKVIAYNYLKAIGKTWKEYESEYVRESTAIGRKKADLEAKAKEQLRSDYDKASDFLREKKEEGNAHSYGHNITRFERLFSALSPTEALAALETEYPHLVRMAGHDITRDLSPPSSNFFVDPIFKVKQPADSKLPPAALIDTYLQGTWLHTMMMIPVPKKPVVADPILRFSGTWIIANQGKGKTNLLRGMIRNRMNENCSIIVFDSKPELALQLRERQFPKETVTIDPGPYLALNALDLGTHNVATLMYLFSSLLDAKLTPLQSGLFQNALHLCTLIPNATFATFRDVISNGSGKYPGALAQLDEEDTEFWIKSFNESTYKNTRNEILWRLNTLRPSGSLFRTMFNAPKTLVKMQPLMDSNTLTIINNSRADLDPLQSEFYARLFLVMILGVAEQRSKIPESQRFPCYVIMDEAQTIISREPLLSDIIHRMRSMKIALVCAHQSLSQLKDPLVESALDDCAIKYANNDHDAPALAQRFRTTTDHLQNLQIGEFAFWFQGQPGAATYKAPWEDLSEFPMLTTAAVAQRDAEMRRRYCYTPEPRTQGLIEPPDDTPDQPGTWGGKPVL